MSSQLLISSTPLKQQIDASKSTLFLLETEESWETISHGINSLSAICRNGAFDFTADLVPIVRSISRPLTNAMNSERTRLSGAAMDFVSVLASGLGVGFDPLLPIFFPILLTLCSRTNKVVIARAKACIFTIVEATQLPSILPYFLPSIKEKSASLRLVAAEGTLMCMNCFNPPDLEKETRARDIEAIIRATARDAHADVRKVSKKLFEAYKLLLPSRVESFTNPLTPTIKKYLDIKNLVTCSQPPLARLTSTMEVKGQLSSSTSALSSTRVASKPFNTQTHARSASSASSSNNQSSHGKAITTTKPTRHIPLKASDLDMPPPQYVPVRPSQSSNIVTPVSRSTSSVDARKRTVSSSVRSGTGLSGAVQSGLLVRPTSASGLHEAMRPPHCSSAVSDTSDGRSANGPRRVPLPEVNAQPSDMNKSNRSIATAVTRPLPSHTQSRGKPLPIKRAPERSKPVPQSRGIASSSVDVMPLPSSNPSRSVSQPTLSQLSRARATERKLPATTTVKPEWGQSGRYKAKSLMKSTTNQGAAHKISKAQTEPRPITPCQVPLPPSPSRPGTPRSFIRQRSGSTTPLSIHPSSPVVLFPAPQDTLETSAKTPPKAEHPEEASVQVETVISSRKDASSDPGDAEYGRERTLPPEPLSDDRELEPPSTYETPRPLFSSEDHVDISATKTPISALLTSIHRGFLLTPSSPLSPPQSYLYRDSVLSEGGKDFTTYVPLHTDNPAQTMLLPRKPFMFGVAGEDTGRHALNNVENLEVH